MTTRTRGTARASVLPALALSLVALSDPHVLTAGFVWDDHPPIDEQVLLHEIRLLSGCLAHSPFDGFRASRFHDAVAPIHPALGLIPNAGQLRQKVVGTHHFPYGGYRLEGDRHFFERRLATDADPVLVARLEHVLDDRRLKP